jgi:hypothetical protein
LSAAAVRWGEEGRRSFVQVVKDSMAGRGRGRGPRPCPSGNWDRWSGGGWNPYQFQPPPPPPHFYNQPQPPPYSFYPNHPLQQQVPPVHHLPPQSGASSAPGERSRDVGGVGFSSKRLGNNSSRQAKLVIKRQIKKPRIRTSSYDSGHW